MRAPLARTCASSSWPVCDGHGAVTGRFDGRLEPIAHERGIVGDQHGSPGEPSRGGHRKFYR